MPHTSHHKPQTKNISKRFALSISKRFTLSHTKGFTLVELLIVMVILGILTTIVASSFRSSQEKARDTRRKSDLHAVVKAVEVYFNDKGEYPASLNGELDVSDCDAGETCTWGGGFIDDNGTAYMIKLPEEKTSARSYYYYSEQDNGVYTKYAIFTRLENDQDKDIPVNPISEAYQYYNGTDCGAGFNGCNYAISSPNTTPETFFPLVDE